MLKSLLDPIRHIKENNSNEKEMLIAWTEFFENPQSEKVTFHFVD